ncbi:MAG TPA: hypothetical protein VEX37_08910, partial [Thermomicrobiales bacterium]|nr:hypothetical protein [Thermomicrobiales bacterium]
SGTPQCPHGAVEVVIIDWAEHQAQLVEASRPVLVVVQIVRSLHQIKIYDLAAPVTVIRGIRRPRSPVAIYWGTDNEEPPRSTSNKSIG